MCNYRRRKLVKKIKQFKPDIILIHNGLGIEYQNMLQRMKKYINVPRVFSQQGWLKADENIYLQREGICNLSSMQAMSFEGMIGHSASTSTANNINLAPDVLIVLSHNYNDSIIPNRFKSPNCFINYAIKNIDRTRTIYIKSGNISFDPTPLLIMDNIVLVGNGTSLTELLNKVGHIITMDNAVCIEALPFMVNIYQIESSILDNKNLTITPPHSGLELNNNLVGDMSQRLVFVDFLQKQQINIANISNKQLISIEEPFLPLIETMLMSPVAYSIKNNRRKSKLKHAFIKVKSIITGLFSNLNKQKRA